MFSCNRHQFLIGLIFKSNVFFVLSHFITFCVLHLLQISGCLKQQRRKSLVLTIQGTVQVTPDAQTFKEKLWCSSSFNTFSVQTLTVLGFFLSLYLCFRLWQKQPWWAGWFLRNWHAVKFSTLKFRMSIMELCDRGREERSAIPV